MPPMNPRKPPEIDLRKGLHVKLLPETHIEFRVLCFKHALSMQEVVEEFAQRAIIGETWALRLIEDIAEKKKERVPRRFSTFDGDSLYDEIEREEKARREET